MTSVDFFGIKERIVEILKADTTNLWWTNEDPSTKLKFRKIEAGAPTPKAADEPPLPRCWITDDNPISSAKILHTNAAGGNTPNITEYELNYKIIFIAEAKDGQKTEEDLDDFAKSIIDQIQSNDDLRDPATGLIASRLADRTQVTQILKLPNTVGDVVQGREIRLKIWATA